MLSPLSRLYGRIINKRNDLYARGTLRSEPLGAPTVSVGNITVGGTGKTPLVALVAGILFEEGRRVGVISRGYKRRRENELVLVSDGTEILEDASEAGDEPVELASKLRGRAIVVADADRVRAGRWAVEKFGVDAFVLDDAFQHLRAGRDLDIVTIDATDPFGNGLTLPAGILREPLGNLARADLFVVTRSDLADDPEETAERIREHNPHAPIIRSRSRTVRLAPLEGSAGDTRTGRFLAFCALGNPDNFFDQMIREGRSVVATERFRDHHFYTPKDIRRLEKKAAASGAGALLTTAKDAVKLRGLGLTLPCFVAETEPVLEDEKKLREMIRAVLH